MLPTIGRINHKTLKLVCYLKTTQLGTRYIKTLYIYICIFGRLVQDQRPRVKRRGRGVEQSIKCSLPSGVAWRTKKSVLTPGSESLQRRATQPCVSISSFKASISFLTTKHTARVRRPRPASYPPHRPVYEEPLLPPLPESLPFYFPYSSIFVCPLLPFLPTLSFPPPPPSSPRPLPPSSSSSRYRRSRVIDIRGRRHCTQRCCSVIVVGRAPCAR